MRDESTSSASTNHARLHFGKMETLEPRIVLDGDWSAADGASVFGSWGDGGYLTVTTIDLNNEPIVFERAPGGGGSDDDNGARVWQQIALLTTDDGSGGGSDLDMLGGRPLAVHDDRLILGAPHANDGAGAAAVFHYQTATRTWAFETLLDAPGLDAGDGFGWSVDIHGNTAVIGTKAGNEAYVYRDSAGWSLQTTLTPDGDRNGGFGRSVATDGGTIVVGAPGEEGLDNDTSATSGAIYIFERDGNRWGVNVRMDAPRSAVNSEFGHAVDIHSGSVIVGAWLDDDMGTDSGSVFAIGRHSRTWEVEAKLTPATQAAGARFGHDVSASGSRAAAMALGTDDGSVESFAQVFKRRGDRWSLEATLDGGTDTRWRSIAMHGDRVALGSDAGAGAAVVFRKIEQTDDWVLEATLAPSAEEGAMQVGHAVAIHDDTVLLGGSLAVDLSGGDGAVGVRAAAWVMGGAGGTGDDSDDRNDDHGPGDDDDDDSGRDDDSDDNDEDDNDDSGRDDSDDDSDDGDDSGRDDDDDSNDDDSNDDNGGGQGDDGSGDDSDQRGRWIVRSLGTLPDVGVPVSDILTWTDSKDGQTYAAVATESGLVLFTRSADRSTSNGVWTSRNLTTEVLGAELVAGDISVFGTRAGKVYIVGYTADGDLLLYRQTGTGDAGGYDWEFQNITESDLAPRGFSTPRFAGGVVSFVTRWNALNIAGLDEQGRVRAVWTTAGMDHWRSDDLSASSGAPAMSGKLAVFLTPWGGINLAGTDESGALNVTWWVPGFDKWVTSNFNNLFDGPTLDGQSVSAYTTPWGGLNITGRDDRGDLVAYWWVPHFGEHKEDDYWRVSNLSEQIVESDQPTGTLQGLVTPDGQINLFGTNAVDDVVRYFWEPGEHWKMENLTHTAMPF